MPGNPPEAERFQLRAALIISSPQQKPAWMNAAMRLDSMAGAEPTEPLTNR